MKNTLKYLPWIIIALGIFLRLREYFYNRSLWVDEADLVNNILSSSYIDLLGPLIRSQHAPIGFLWLERTASYLFGANEPSLRIFPLIAGIASLFLFKLLVERILNKWTALLALAIFSFSDLMIRYSNEVKQYSIEVLVNLILYLLLFKYGISKLSGKNLLKFLILGSVCLIFSHTAILTLAATGIAGLVINLKHKRTHSLVNFALIGVVWIGVFAVLYFRDAFQAYADTSFLNEWSYFYLVPTNIDQVFENFFGWMTMLAELLGPNSAWLGLILPFVGIYGLVKKNRLLVWLLGGPVILALMASGLHKYPYVTRVFLFGMSSLMIFMALGLEKALSIRNTTVKWIVFGILFLALMFDSFTAATLRSFQPREIEEIKPMLQYLSDRRQPDDYIYVYYASRAAYAYYQPFYNLESVPFYQGEMSRQNWLGYNSQLNGMRSKKRVWFIFSHNIITGGFAGQQMSEEDYFVNYLNKIGKKIDETHDTDASLYLYQFQ